MMSLDATISKALSINNISAKSSTARSFDDFDTISTCTRRRSNSIDTNSINDTFDSISFVREINRKLKEQAEKRKKVLEKDSETGPCDESFDLELQEHLKRKYQGSKSNIWKNHQQDKSESGNKGEEPEPEPVAEIKTETEAKRSCDKDSSSEKHKELAKLLRSARSLKTAQCHTLVEQILQTVGALEYTLFEDHQEDFQLQMALERKSEEVQHLRHSLASEKERNQRLVRLIHSADTSSSDKEPQDVDYGGSSGVGGGEIVQSISPLLMQQRYEELSVSYRQVRQLLAKKERLLRLTKCEAEETQAKYDNLFDQYRRGQAKLEELCIKYLTLQAKKNREIQKLRDALTYASDCIVTAQQLMDMPEDDMTLEEKTSKKKQVKNDFQSNLRLFVNALKLSEWVQRGCKQTLMRQSGDKV